MKLKRSYQPSANKESQRQNPLIINIEKKINRTQINEKTPNMDGENTNRLNPKLGTKLRQLCMKLNGSSQPSAKKE